MKLNPFLLLCTTGLFAVFSSTISKSPVLPLFASHLGANPSKIGIIASVSALAGIVFSVPAGLLADRFGKKKLILSSALIFSSAPFGYLVVTNIWHLAVIRFYHGFATAIFLPVAMALISSLSQKERGEKLGWFSTATLVGRFLAPVIGGSILGLFTLQSSLGYKVVYAVCGGAGLITILLALILPVPEEMMQQVKPSWKETFHAFKAVLLDRRILVTCFVEASILFAYGTFETFLPLYAVSNGLTAAHVGVFLSGQIIVLALTKPVMGKFSDTHGRRLQIFVGGLLGAACVGGFSLFSSFFSLLFLSIAFGLCLSFVTSATSAYIADLSSQHSRGSAMGLLGSIMDIGHTTGPLTSGIVVSLLGYGEAFIGASFVLLFSAFFFLLSVGLSTENTVE